MKKLFCGIGFLLVVFCSLQFFLVVEEKVVYLNDEQPYDIMLEEFMTASEIEQIAKENDVTLVNRECISNLFGKRHYKFNIINPSDKMKEGQEKILFGTGKKEIIFIKASSEKRFKHLFLFDNDENKYKNVLQSLNKRKYIYETDKLQRLNISWDIILLEKSRKFFILIVILSIISISAYYVYRLKEIGILRLNGWSCRKISWEIMKGIMINTVIGWTIPSMMMIIYIVLKDYKLMWSYLMICGIALICQFVFYILGHIVAVVYVYRMNCVSAIKNSKNNNFIFVMLLITKMLVIIFLFVDINSAFKNFVYNKDINTGYERVKDADLYVLSQHVPLGEKSHNVLSKEMEKIPDKDIYTYVTYADSTHYSSADIRKLKKTGIRFDIKNMFICSKEMLKYIQVKDVKGKNISARLLKDKEKVFLIPEHNKNHIERIKKYYNCEDEDILYIKDNQSFISYTQVGEYWFDSIIIVCNVEKCVSPNTLLTSNGKKIMEEILKKTNLEGDNISITSLEAINREMKDNNDIEMIYIFINLIIVIVSYVLTSISITIIYFELNKKSFGVYMLLGRKPVKDIVFLPIINVIIISVLALKINTILLFVNILDIILYGMLMFNYLYNNAILALKGE